MLENYRAFWQFLVVALFFGFLWLVVKAGEEGIKVILGGIWIITLIASIAGCVSELARRI